MQAPIPKEYPLFDQEISRLTIKYNLSRDQIAKSVGVTRATIYKYIIGEWKMKVECLIRLGEVYPDFDTDKWLCCFGYLPDSLTALAKEDPDMVIDEIRAAFKVIAERFHEDSDNEYWVGRSRFSEHKEYE